MRRRTIAAMTLALSASVIFSIGGASTAAAATDTGWVPVGPGDDFTVEACRTTLTVSEVVNKVEFRERTDDRGNVRTDYRGKYVVKVSAPDGRRVTLDNSGPYTTIEFANGNFFATIAAPAFIYPFDDEEARAFRAAGLPPVFYYKEGRLDLFIEDGRETVLKRPKQVTSICRLLR